jgi:hypothetical protein
MVCLLHEKDTVEIVEVFLAPGQLPEVRTTGTPLPRVGTICLLSLAASFGLRFAAAKAR